MAPHVHHWDSMMAFEETEGVLFPADLYAHPGERPPVSSENLADEMIAWYRWAGFMPSEAARASRRPRWRPTPARCASSRSPSTGGCSARQCRPWGDRSARGSTSFNVSGRT
jgi:hypothetical protein